MARLGDVCIINPKGKSLDDECDVSFVPMQSVSEDGTVDVTTIRKYGEVKKGFTNFQDGDILFAKITPCMENGKGCIANGLKNGMGFGSTEFHVLRPKSELVTSEWIFYLTSWPEFRKECEKNMTGSAGQKRVPKTFLENYQIDIPSLDEQDRITAQLDKVSDLIAKRRAQLDKLDLLVKAKFLEMFGDIHNSTDFPYLPIKDFANVVSGGTPDRNSPQYWDNGTIKWVKTTELQNGIIEDTEEKITKQGLENSSAKIVPADTILIAMYGQGKTRGMTGYLAVEAATNQACACILPSSKINQKYLWYYMIMSYEKLRSLAKGGNQPNLNGAMIKSFLVLMPPKELQDLFVAFVEHTEETKTSISWSLAKLETLKKALMQGYFG